MFDLITFIVSITFVVSFVSWSLIIYILVFKYIRLLVCCFNSFIFLIIFCSIDSWIYVGVGVDYDSDDIYIDNGSGGIFIDGGWVIKIVVSFLVLLIINSILFIFFTILLVEELFINRVFIIVVCICRIYTSRGYLDGV